MPEHAEEPIQVGDRVVLMSGPEKGKVGTVADFGIQLVRVTAIFDARFFSEVFAHPDDLEPAGKEGRMAEQPESTIEVIVEEGMVKGINGIPEGVKVVVKDFDIDGLTEEDLKDLPTENGQKYLIYVYPPEAANVV